MDVAYLSQKPDQADLYESLMRPLVPGLRLHRWPAVPDPARIEAALAWLPPQAAIDGMPNLRLVCNLGMGVDYLLTKVKLPAGVRVTRLVDPNMIEQMTEYVVHAALHHHRLMPDYERFQRERRWEELPLPHTAERRIGVLGMGTIGTHTATTLAMLKFPVAGWSNSPKHVPGVESFFGADQLDAFLARSDILVCLLPLTPATREIVNARTLSRLPKGAYIINLARGGHVNEADLLAAMDSGHIAGAALDVLQEEPPRADHPFWTHPKVRLTPHIAGLTNPHTAAEQIAENLRRYRAGEPLVNVVDPAKGY